MAVPCGTLVCVLMSPTPYRLAEGYGSALWFVLVTEWTLVNVDQLDTALSTYDPHKVSSDSL